jgi:hypothetical protein
MAPGLGRRRCTILHLHGNFSHGAMVLSDETRTRKTIPSPNHLGRKYA